MQAFFVNAQEKSSIKSMTSNKTAKKNEEKLPAPARAQSTLKLHSVGVGVGQTFLGGDFEDNGDDSITADLFYNYSASHSFDLLINGHYSVHKLGQKKVNLSGAAVGIKAKAYQFDSFAPFALAGLGFYSPKVKRTIGSTIKESDSKLVFGTTIGVGMELKLNKKFAVGIMGQFHNPFDIKQELDPEVEGSYHKLLITTFYSF